MISAIAGLLAGMAHVFAGPDHLSAIAPLSMQREQKKPWLLGMRWGVGHTGGVLAVGALMLLGRNFIPFEQISSWSERLVGLVLLGVGFWGLRKAFSRQLHTHEHQHGGEKHVHLHYHPPKIRHEEQHQHSHAATSIGLLHGLAGSSHFFGVLPALALPGKLAAANYLIGFGVGTVFAMAAFSYITARLMRQIAGNNIKSYRVAMGLSSIATVAVGAYWLGSF